MVHFILWLSLLCASTTRGIINDIVGAVGGGGGIPGLGDLTNKVNSIVNKVNVVPEILNVVDDIEDFVEDIEDTANSVFNKVNDIVQDTAKLVKLLENPLKTIDPSDDIKDLANTLVVCIDDMKKLIPGAVLFDAVLDLGDDVLDLLPFDPEDMVFKVLAGGLLPIKSQVEFVCIDILPTVTSMLGDILDHIPSIDGREGETRRRLWEYDECDTETTGINDIAAKEFDGFCQPRGVVYPYGSSDGHQEMIRFLSDGGFTTNDADGGNNTVKANILQRYRIARYILGIMVELFDEIGEAGLDCGDVAFGNVVGVKCAIATIGTSPAYAGLGIRPTRWLVHTFIGILDFAVESAEYHDGNILAARVDAIFHDRKTIIHNQLKLRDYLYDANVDRQDKYDQLIADIATLQATVASLPNLNGAGGGNGNGNGNSAGANAEHGAMMDDVNRKTGDEGLTVINLRIKTGDLYIVAGLFIGFIAIFIGMTVALILNCCNGSNSGYHRVVKYETESEIEQK